MVRARLHLICGNCGCSEMFEHEVKEELNDVTEEMETVVYIACNNCNTLHDLDDNSKLINER